jgi:hypothetical protein
VEQHWQFVPGLQVSEAQSLHFLLTKVTAGPCGPAFVLYHLNCKLVHRSSDTVALSHSNSPSTPLIMIRTRIRASPDRHLFDSRSEFFMEYLLLQIFVDDPGESTQTMVGS